MKRADESREAKLRLTEPLALEDGRAPRLATMTLYSLSAFVLAAVAWASVTDVREITVAPGQLSPSASVHVVQHLEGGIVADVLVRDGEGVEEGQPILKLDPAQASAEHEQLRVRFASLTLQTIRLQAQANGRIPDFGEAGRSQPRLMADQVAVYESELMLRRRERETLTARLMQRRSERDAAINDLKFAEAQAATAREQLAIQERLVREGYGSRRQLLDAQAASHRANGEAAAARGRRVTLNEAVDEAEKAVAEAESTAARRTAEELAKAAAELAEVEQQLAKFTDRVDRLIVRAPTSGLVQEMAPKARGEVIRPGDVVARIVPNAETLRAEVRLNPKDIGHVKVGARADVKVTTFDTATFGSLYGVVESISATTIAGNPNAPAGSEAAQPHYRVIVRLQRMDMGEGALRRPLQPGMVVQAEIITGEKSIVRYMLKPVFRSLDVAFTER
jgi:HlyD family secretion protein/adhesin transport system membrane fusion protein